MQLARNVYSVATWLHGERLREKLAVTRPLGARFASVDFLTGKLDRDEHADVQPERFLVDGCDISRDDAALLE